MSSAIAHHPNVSKVEASGFDRFDLDPSLVRGLRAAGFDEPRPIQAETIPACLAGRDVMGLAQTGTGKTAAFALPILQGLLEESGRGPLVLIVAPTRELALQIAAEIRLLARYTEVETAVLIGGVPAGKQIQALKRDPEIVVGCPGRILDLWQQKKLHLSAIDTLVLDEADHMFDMGFLPDIRRILGALPAKRQNLLFSATMPSAIRRLANDLLTKPHVVELAHSTPAERIEHFLYAIDEGRKRSLLEHLIEGEDCKTAIVFTRTKHRAKRLATQLSNRGHDAVALQGNMSQSQRDRAMSGFREGKFDILVATDIAARGLDVAGVDYVINYDVPNSPDVYTHRIGRTGRSECSGKACTFVTSEDRGWLRDTERVLGSAIPRKQTEGLDLEVQKSPRGGSSQGRRSSRGARSAAQGRGRQQSKAHGGSGAGNRRRRARRPAAQAPR